jgi:hypothetical protein
MAGKARTEEHRMGVHVTVTYRCGGCSATATAPEQTVRREFVSLSGRSYGVGSYVLTPIKIEGVAPDGWAAFDPYTQCTYCPECWASICGDLNADAAREADQ